MWSISESAAANRGRLPVQNHLHRALTRCVEYGTHSSFDIVSRSSHESLHFRDKVARSFEEALDVLVDRSVAVVGLLAEFPEVVQEAADRS